MNKIISSRSSLVLCSFSIILSTYAFVAISSNTGTIYFNEVDSSYLYNYEEDGVEYIKLYDKMDNCYLYQFVSGYTNLIKVTSNTGRVQNFTWSSNKLVGITNDDNDSISITYNLDNTVSILDNRTSRLVELSFENGIFIHVSIYVPFRR